MDEGVMRERVARARVGRLATVTAASRPHVVPCCFVLDDDVIYSAVDAKPKSTNALKRLENLRVNADAALLVDHYDDDWASLWWVRVDGRASVLETGADREHALDLLAKKYAQYRDARPPGSVIAIAISKWGGWP